MRVHLAVAVLLVLAQTAVAENKSAGNITVLGDSAVLSAGGLGAAGGLYVLDGAFAGVAHDSSSVSNTDLESGFYSRMVSSPVVDYAGTNISSYTLSFTAPNPQGTTYELYVSTWAQADPYMVYYSTDENGYPVETLTPNTSFYNFVLANYMDGDYSPAASTTTVTLAAAPSTGTFTLTDAGHSTLNLSFAGFENPPPVSGSAWTTAEVAILPAARYGQASVVYGTHVFVTGGFDGVIFSSAIYRGTLDNAGNISIWPHVGFMPAARYGHQLIAARGRLYLLGGYDSTGSHDEVWSADISSTGAIGAWLPETPLPYPVYFHAAVFAGGRIIVSGGYESGVGVLASVYSADLWSDGALTAWDSRPSMDAPRYAHSMTVVGGDRLYVAGGKDGASARSDVWVSELDPATGLPLPWTTATSLPSPRYGHKTLAAANRLYVIGGNNGSTAQAQVFQATVAANSLSPAVWQAYYPLGSARQFPAAEVIGEKLYVFGGSDGSLAKNTVFTSTLSGTQYMVEIAEDDLFTTGVRSSGWISSPDKNFGELKPITDYYFRAKARNWNGIQTAYSPVGSTITYAAIPGTAAWTSIGSDYATINWLANGNPGGYQYQVIYSTSADFNTSTAAITTAFSKPITALSQSTTYYARVRVLNALGRSSRFADIPPVKTTYNPALDTSSPTVTDAQTGFADWKSTNTFTCAVTFEDPAGGSGLDRFEVKVASETGGDTGILRNWTAVAANINQDTYAQPWTLPQTAWDAMIEGVTSYVSVRAFDNASNLSSTVDLFYVLKDTTPPSISVAYSTPSVWYSEYPGDISGLRFDDAVSGLYKLQYSVSANKNFADATVIGWTDINSPALVPGSTWYEPADIAYSFAQLANAASNYFSFRAVDMAGSTSTLTDAFGIGKNVSGPTVAISTPALTYLSTFTWVAGTTAETNALAVKGTEVFIRDLSSTLYYNAGNFLSGARVWHDAQDVANTFSITFGGLNLVSGRQYQIVARSSDTSGDYSQLYATHTFVFDSQSPSAHVLYPADGSSANSAVSISGTALDAVSGISSVEVIFKRLTDGKWWDNSVSAWVAAPQNLQVGTTPYWTWNFNNPLRDGLTNGASYYVSVRASDGSGPQANTGAFNVYGSTFTYYDLTPPPQTLTLTAAQGSFSGSVDLFWRTAGDNAASGYLLNGSYKIAYSTYTGAPVSTASAQITITTATLTAGSTQFRLVTGLDASASYYFTLWTADDALNWSPASNEASALAGAPDSGSLTGNVSDASSQPVTGVLVEAIAPSGAVEGSDYTDTFGNYAIPGLNSLYLTIRAVWAAQDIESSVSKDGVPNGSAAVNFTLSVSYQLASISGVIPANYIAKSVTRAAPKARYTTREVKTFAGSPAFVEIYRKGRRIGAAFADSGGGFEIPNLLPGTYGLRVYNGSDYSRMANLTLKPGERLVFTPKWDLLNKDNVYAYPNPANSEVNFHFAPTAASFDAEVEVFDISGRLLKTLQNVSNDTVAGGKKISWNIGREKIASGVYLYILRVKDTAAGTTEKVVKKFAVIR